MRNLKFLIVGLLLTFSGSSLADAGDIPGTSTWYLHVDLEQIRTNETSKGIYAWMQDEIFAEIKEETGADIGQELEHLTAFSLQGQGPVFLFEGDISQTTKDRLMTLIAATGDLRPSESSGKQYYRMMQGTDDGENGKDGNSHDSDLEFDFESLEDEAWVSMAFDDKIFITASEDQMKALIANGGKIGGQRGRSNGNGSNAMLVLTAENTLLQAGLNPDALDDDGDSSWESNILRNTEQVAFMVAAKAKMLAIEAKLVTTEPEMANSLASVVRGLVSLARLSGDLDAEAVALIEGMDIDTAGRNLTMSMALDPALVLATLRD